MHLFFYLYYIFYFLSELEKIDFSYIWTDLFVILL